MPIIDITAARMLVVLYFDFIVLWGGFNLFCRTTKLRDGATERRRLQLKRNRAVLWSALFGIMQQNEFETVDEAYLEVVKLRAQIKGIGDEMKETLYMVRTGATNEHLDCRVRNALAQYGVALFEAR